MTETANLFILQAVKRSLMIFIVSTVGPILTLRHYRAVFIFLIILTYSAALKQSQKRTALLNYSMRRNIKSMVG